MRLSTIIPNILIYLAIFGSSNAYFWNEEVTEKNRPYPTSTSSNGNTPSNFGCFMCTQLLSVTKHRVGLSENQLRNQLYEKCRVLPSVFKSSEQNLQEQCFAFVETSLPEIYYSINYDIASKDVCVRMNFCDETNPFASGGPLPSPIDKTTEVYPPEEIEEEYTTTSTTRRRPTTTTTVYIPPTTTTITTTTTTPTPTTPSRTFGGGSSEEKPDRIGYKNVLQIVLPSRPPVVPTRPTYVSRNSIDQLNSREKVPEKENQEVDEKRLTCAFCERMLENAKNYASDITSFANSACSSLAKGRQSDQCYQMADKKIAELAKFVDQQVVDALWCAELNRC